MPSIVAILQRDHDKRRFAVNVGDIPASYVLPTAQRKLRDHDQAGTFRLLLTEHVPADLHYAVRALN